MQSNYELIILGAGISGLGVALAATERNISTLILEAHTPASATSNNTLRIIHGGFRYLQKLQLARVVRSLNDQSYVAKTFSDAVTPLPCLMPLKPFGLKSRIPVSIAALLYGTTMKLAGSPLPAPRVLSQRALEELAPQLATSAQHGALCWHDLVMTDPKAIARKLTEQVVKNGATIKTFTRATAVTKTDKGYTVTTESGATGAPNQFSSQEFSASKVVNTLGPWIHSIKLPDHLTQSPNRWCLGFNITISRQIHPTHAIAIESPDGRLFFAVPRGSETTIGTWYTPCAAPQTTDLAAATTIPEAELLKFMNAWNNAWPEQEISANEISSTDAGILPMLRETPSGPELYGAEVIRNSNDYYEVLSTKYTTFRSQGQRVVRGFRDKNVRADQV